MQVLRTTYNEIVIPPRIQFSNKISTPAGNVQEGKSGAQGKLLGIVLFLCVVLG